MMTITEDIMTTITVDTMTITMEDITIMDMVMATVTEDLDSRASEADSEVDSAEDSAALASPTTRMRPEQQLEPVENSQNLPRDSAISARAREVLEDWELDFLSSKGILRQELTPPRPRADRKTQRLLDQVFQDSLTSQADSETILASVQATTSNQLGTPGSPGRSRLPDRRLSIGLTKRLIVGATSWPTFPAVTLVDSVVTLELWLPLPMLLTLTRMKIQDQLSHLSF